VTFEIGKDPGGAKLFQGNDRWARVMGRHVSAGDIGDFMARVFDADSRDIADIIAEAWIKYGTMPAGTRMEPVKT